MAERSAGGTELAVQELRRKARRRLVGAIVLALAAAVILPLLLEKEPKPLGDDVSVQIPPIDQGKFVNRLTGRASEDGASKGTAKVEPKAEAKREVAPETKSGAGATAANPAPEAAAITPAPAAPEARKSLSEAEQRVLSPPTKASAKADAGKAAKPDAPEMRATPDSAVPAAAKPATPAPAAAAASPGSESNVAANGKPEGFAVQIAAFTDDKGANALAGKLKKAGFASTYVEPVQTSRGTLWRVRVGGYPARADADAARAKLKADGWNGIVVVAN
jgi:DedD protein